MLFRVFCENGRQIIYQLYVCMIMIFLIRIGLFFWALGSFVFVRKARTVPFKHTGDKSRRPFFCFFLVKATIVQKAVQKKKEVLYCTVLYHRQTTAKFTFSAGLVKTRKTPGVLSYFPKPQNPI